MNSRSTRTPADATDIIIVRIHGLEPGSRRLERHPKRVEVGGRSRRLEPTCSETLSREPLRSSSVVQSAAVACSRAALPARGSASRNRGGAGRVVRAGRAPPGPTVRSGSRKRLSTRRPSCVCARASFPSQRRGVELVVAQAAGGQPVRCPYFQQPAPRAGPTKADVVWQHQQDVGDALGAACAGGRSATNSW